MEKVPQNLRKQLAIAVRSIQWSYSIFWAISSSEQGVLEWSEGFYNGDIKTRKTIQAVEWDVDQMSLKRSEQLRELYESLLTVETNAQTRRPSAALIPEDLSDTEWFYLVCMSFVFNLGQGLPGTALQNGEPIWLCNAHQADSRLFSRSLLAKSASIQTVVCFPFLGGVVELGATDLVLEDHSLIKYVQDSLLVTDCSALPRIPISVTPIVQSEEMRSVECPNNSLIHLMEDTKSMMTEGVNVDLIDDDLSNCVYTSMTSNDCISQSLGYPEDLVSIPKIENVSEIHPQAENTEDSCVMRTESDDLHYKNVLGSIFNTSHGLIRDRSVRNCNMKSCFGSWRKKGVGSYNNPRYGNSQKILKKVLFEVPRMHSVSSSEHNVDSERVKTDLWKPEADELVSNSMLTTRRRMESVDDRFCELKSLIPSIDKVDKVSILDDTIKYMKELERRVEELEGSQDHNESDGGRTRTKTQDAAERTSDNYKNNKAGIKRKAEDANDEGKLENSLVSIRDSSTNTNLSINLIQKDVSIDITCPWKECLLLEIIDALTNLRLDTHSVQSSRSDNSLSINIKAKIKVPGGLSAGMIRQVLQRVVLRS